MFSCKNFITYLLVISVGFLRYGEGSATIKAEGHTNHDMCSFDNNSNPTCYWRNGGSELNFIRQSGPTMSHSTGPPGDHSKYQNGSYVYLEASNKKFGSRATLISKLFRATIGRTLKFYAYMYGRTVNYLKVFLRKQNSEVKEILKISGNQGKKWIKLKVRFASLIPYQIIIEAAAGRTFQSDIAIDDIMFIDDLIPITGWSQWNSWTTCQVKDEWCSKERFRLCLDQDPTFCGLRDGKLQREIASCDPSHCKVDGHWSTWSSWSDCLAVCGSGTRQRTRECNEPKPMYGGKQCVGRKQQHTACWAGHCDIGPDDCDFDDDTDPWCHWTNVNTTLGFQRKYLWTGTAGTGPLGDHSNNTHGKYIFLETSFPAKYGQHAQIASKEFKPTRLRTLKFYTYMYGRSVNYLRVLLKTENSTREIWRLEGNHGRKWILGRVDFKNLLPYRIIFEAGVGKNYQSDIAIDTIHFVEHKIPKKPEEKSTYKQKQQNKGTFLLCPYSLLCGCFLIIHTILGHLTH